MEVQSVQIFFFILFIIGLGSLIWVLMKGKETIEKANRDSAVLISRAKAKIEKDEIASADRIDRLKHTDDILRKRIKEARILIGNITDLACMRAANIDILTEDDLLSSQSYQEDRKSIKKKLKELAKDAFVSRYGQHGGRIDVNSGHFVAIGAKSDMAGALLLTTVEMLCSKCNHNNSYKLMEQLHISIIATETLVKAIDHEAAISLQFKDSLEERLEIESNWKKAKYKAKEEQKEIREQEREEKKARQEAEKLQNEAEKEEEIKRKAIAELELKIAEQSESERASFKYELEKLQQELSEAHAKFERARSRAQDTRQGHVYVISNIGSFGKEMLKIGMTRRLNPMDRVKELGDASVPFTFDVHALIECDDAPSLEKSLHKIFDKKRVNMINRRKEFFYVNVDDIEIELNKLGINALINRIPSAEQYYESCKLIN